MISKHALNYLAIPATSASVERLFSIAGIPLSGRMKIGAELIGNETLLKYNKKFLKNDYIFWFIIFFYKMQEKLFNINFY